MKQLKERIKQSGLKQSYIAERVGISASHLTMMLNEKAKMSETVKIKIDNLLTNFHV
jgi:predicted XRE-type DNA-binding protein